MMKKLNLIFLLAAFLCLFYSCKKQNRPAIFEINLESAVGTNSEIKSSDFITSFEYIPLETSEECLIGNTNNIYLIDDNLIALTENECFIFDKTSGKFKNQISRQGRGPGEYNNVLGLIDSEKKTVFFQRSSGEVLEYSLQNTLVNQFSIPLYDSGFESPSIPTVFAIYKDWLLCYFTNLIGNEEKLIMGVNRSTGKSDFIIPNTNTLDLKRMVITTNEADFYTFSGKQFFKEIYNDTIYNLQDSVLKPHGIFQTGKYHYTYENKWDKSIDKTKLITLRNIIELNQYIYFEYNLERKYYSGLYSKDDEKLVVSQNNEGIPNDIDNFINFSPITIISDNMVIGVIDAYKISEWFSNNPEKIASLPEDLKKLKSIDENDNPIVMIAKLKE